ncbi:long-chain fatty alcohol dehydrogenase [Annulohypoxylon bovei var. microspora]|nr:long-chain fatty alcohol dehydrogenase [Annulohypoxylon bovei var. microspora]
MTSDIIFPEPQWKALLALLDATVPSVEVADPSAVHDNSICISQEEFDNHYHDTRRIMKCPPSREMFKDYLAARPSDNRLFVKLIKTIIHSLPPGSRLRLSRTLNLMMTRFGSLISTGYFTPFNKQSLAVREAILQSWQHSWLFLWPSLARTFIQIGTMMWCQADSLFKGLSNYNHNIESPHSKPAPAIDFGFMAFTASPQPAFIETDIVIVGSGCGGSVCAKVLTEAGHRVIVVDKGYYIPPNQLPIAQGSTGMLFEGKSGSLKNSDGSMMVVAGSCWGGGGTINWSVGLPLPDSVRKEWADVDGLSFFTSQGFQDSIDRVSDFMHLGEANPQHNHANRVLLEGSKKLGWRAQTCLRNTTADHHCGSRCGNGCRASKKQGPAVTWLPDAVKAGAQCIEGFEVSEVLFEDKGHDGFKEAIGVVGKWTSRDEDGGFKNELKSNIQRLVHIKARKVIVSTGTLNTPLVLSRSGLKNPHIGKNLHAHPTCSMSAIFDRDIYGWEGEIISSVVTEFEDLDGKGHGPRIEPTSMLPHTAIFQVPWYNGIQFKLDALKYRQMSCFIALTRDRDSGSVTADPDNRSPVVTYIPSSFDRANMIVGLVAIAKLSYIQGAVELLPMVPGLRPFRCSKSVHDRDVNDADFAEWLTCLQQADLKPSASVFGCAHQMGTCRMSASPTDGVVDEHGKVWGTESLYVADASVFPSASGVNPMLTIMAIADHIARGMLRQM